MLVYAARLFSNSSVKGENHHEKRLMKERITSAFHIIYFLDLHPAFQELQGSSHPLLLRWQLILLKESSLALGLLIPALRALLWNRFKNKITFSPQQFTRNAMWQSNGLASLWWTRACIRLLLAPTLAHPSLPLSFTKANFFSPWQSRNR